MIKIYLAKYDGINAIESAKERILARYFCDCGYRYEIAHLPSGEPILMSSTSPKRYVSIGHSDGILVMAFSESKVGVDIERKDRDISPKICPNIEAWTRIEAYAKWTGNGLSKDLISHELPKNLLYSKSYGEYVISICGECQIADMISLD